MLKILHFLKRSSVARNGIIYRLQDNTIKASNGESFTKLEFLLRFKPVLNEFKPVSDVDYLEQEHQNYISKVTESGMPLWLADQLNYRP